jgi:cob(I)alamin adenosyltransferase
MRDSHFYSRRGDDGYTGLLGPERVPKYDPRPDAYGTADEAQAAMGLARASNCTVRSGEVLLSVQRDLYSLMAELAAAGEAESPFRGSITAGHVGRLEGWIAEYESQVEMPKEFVVPGDSQPGAALHLARTVIRRAERLAVRLVHGGLLENEQVLPYLNRLSSLLFVMALFEDQAVAGSGTTLAKDGVPRDSAPPEWAPPEWRS